MRIVLPPRKSQDVSNFHSGPFCTWSHFDTAQWSIHLGTCARDKCLFRDLADLWLCSLPVEHTLFGYLFVLNEFVILVRCAQNIPVGFLKSLRTQLLIWYDEFRSRWLGTYRVRETVHTKGGCDINGPSTITTRSLAKSVPLSNPPMQGQVWSSKMYN